MDADLTIKSGPFKGKPQQWFTRAEVQALLDAERERCALAVEAAGPKEGPLKLVTAGYAAAVRGTDGVTPSPARQREPGGPCTFPNCKGGTCCMNPSNAPGAVTRQEDADGGKR